MTAAMAGERLLVRMPPGRLAERRYVLDLLLTEWLGLGYDLVTGAELATTIHCAADPEGGALTLPDVLLSASPDDWLTPRSMPPTPLAWVDGLDRQENLPAAVRQPDLVGSELARSSAHGGRLPVLYGSPTDGRRALEGSTSGISTPIDIFGSAFWFLTRYEELVQTERDRHGRFPVAASVASQNDLVTRPLVDEYVQLLVTAIRSLWPDMRPATRPFRLRLTHDVDVPFGAWGRSVGSVARSVAGDLVRRHDPRLAGRRAVALVDARRDRIDRDPVASFDFLMDISERHGLRSTFYFMAGTDPAGIDVRYQISDRPFASVLRRIHDRGHEIGLHGGYGTYLSRIRPPR